MTDIDEHHAKMELVRLNGLLNEPILIIGGLAVRYYYRGRSTSDLDIVCSLSQQKFIDKEAYPSDEYEFEERQTDLRPEVVYKNIKTGTKIYIGSKILERNPYPYIIYNDYFDGSVNFKYDDVVCDNVLVPSAHHLAFTKIISFHGRRSSPKSLQDLEDFSNISNHRSFALNHFINYMEGVGAKSVVLSALDTQSLSKQELQVFQRSSLYKAGEFTRQNNPMQQVKKIPKKPPHVKHPNQQKSLKVGPKQVRAVDHGPKIKLRDMYFGTIDANYEMQHAGEQRKELFYETYFRQPGVDPDLFLKGERFIAHGLKGTGKSSLLRYLEMRVLKDEVSTIRPIVYNFNSEFPKDIYDDVRRAFNGDMEYTSQQRSNIYRDLDYVSVWIYTLCKYVAYRMSDHPEAIFENNFYKEKFLKLLNSIREAEEENVVYKFLPNIKDGYINYFDPVTGVERRLKFRDYVELVLKAYGSMTPIMKDPLYMLLDEIEPRIGSGILFELDCILIRDLVHAVSRLNGFQNADARNVYFIVAVRSEILAKETLLGEQFGKKIEIFGCNTDWGDLGPVNLDHPLLQMVCAKIALSEKRHGISTLDLQSVEEIVWPKYFRKSKRETLEPKILMDKTWHRPRDVVRMLNYCQEKSPLSEEITEGLLQRVTKRYSSGSWAELSHHLVVSIDPFALEGLEAVLTGIPREFSRDEFADRVGAMAEHAGSVARLAKKNAIDDILRDMYQAGVIGSKSRSSGNRFIFRGDGEPDTTGNYVIHPGLFSHFSVLSARKTESVRAAK
jgi:hypothetical protein